MTLILSGTNGLSDVDGDASTPAVRGTDTNTGIFFGSDIIGFSEGGVECARFNSSGNLAFPDGNGIDFSASAGGGATSSILDDYEEGTYTVRLFDASGGGNASSTTTTGYYTKIGNQVTCWFDSLSSISTAGMTTSNALYMSLPFSASPDNGASGSVAISDISSRQGTAIGYVVPFVLASNARGRFYGCKPDTAIVNIRPAEITGGSFYQFTMTYKTA